MMNLHVMKIYFAAMVFFSLVGCRNNKPAALLDLDGIEGNSTWSRPEALKASGSFELIAEGLFEWVSESSKDEAWRLLKEESWVQLSHVEAAHFSRESFASQTGIGTYVLLRGLETVAHKEDLVVPLQDVLTVGWSNGEVLVTHESSREQNDRRAHQRAVIAFLPSLPTNVYPVTLVAVTGG